MLLTLLLSVLANVSQPPAGPIVIDGTFDDWAAVAVAVTDPADAPNAFVDFGNVKAAHDARHMYLKIDLGRTVNAQGLDGTAMILLDVDGEPATGDEYFGLPGVDVIVELTPPNRRSPNRPGMGMGVRSTTYHPDPNDPSARQLGPYDIGLRFGPTHAGRRMEFRIDRGVRLPQTPPMFLGETLNAKLVYLDSNGELRDETDPFTHELSIPFDPHPRAIEQASDPLARPARDAVRVVSWNVHHGAMLTDPQPFARTLAALNPDVLLLQELPETTSAEELERFLNGVLAEGGRGRRQWTVVLGEGGGDLRSAVASALPVEPSEPFRLVSFPDQPHRTVRAAGAIIESGSRRFLAVSVHLKCCGRIGGREDETRIEEVTAVREAIRAACEQGGLDGLVVAGDFNLVGGREPLELMMLGLDFDQSSLTVAEALQLDGLSNDTWADARQPFAPATLDYLLYADSAMRLGRAFVYDASDLSPRWRDVYGTEPDDTTIASDHLPIAADLFWIGGAR